MRPRVEDWLLSLLADVTDGFPSRTQTTAAHAELIHPIGPLGPLEPTVQGLSILAGG